jgi:hypothetical protein
MFFDKNFSSSSKEEVKEADNQFSGFINSLTRRTVLRRLGMAAAAGTRSVCRCL